MKVNIIIIKKIISGVDEAGRGSWAGPVVSAAVILKNYPNAEELKDSKTLNKKDRNEIFDKLKNNSIIGVGFSSVKEIEKFNILQATFLSMKRAVNSLTTTPDLLLIDGNMVPPKLTIEAYPIIKGDKFISEISAASIVAKVIRDSHMKILDKKYPGYGFTKNAGYGVKLHLHALKTLGVTPIHRQTFKPIHNILYKEN